jgi:hypothetical protein
MPGVVREEIPGESPVVSMACALYNLLRSNWGKTRQLFLKKRPRELKRDLT